jgi:transcriptional regulator with XRE-family HTH domain
MQCNAFWRAAMTERLIRVSRGYSQALRTEITARGLTLLEVDHRAGLGEGHCSAILNGKRIPKIDTLLRILDVLDLDLAFAPSPSQK